MHTQQNPCFVRDFALRRAWSARVVLGECGHNAMVLYKVPGAGGRGRARAGYTSTHIIHDCSRCIIEKTTHCWKKWSARGMRPWGGRILKEVYGVLHAACHNGLQPVVQDSDMSAV